MKKRILIGISIALVAIAAAFTGGYFFLKSEVNETDDNVILNHIYVENKDVSGLTVEEAKKILDEQLAVYQGEKAVLKLGEVEAEVTLGELGLTGENLEEVLEQAAAYGKSGSVWNRYQTMKSLEKEKKVFDVLYAVDADTVKTVLAEKTKDLGVAPQNATISRQDGKFVVTEDVDGVQVDVEASAELIVKHFDEKWVHGGAENFELLSAVKEAEIQSEALAQIKDALGTYTTKFDSGNNRAKNIALAASRINGTVLMPGQEMSASDGMGKRTEANGYLPAGTYLNGEVVDGTGGGVCQVSTTLYNAVLNAELEVTERSPHSMIVSYVPAAQDAAISEGYKDLKFKNNTDTPIYIEGYTSGGSITFTIYGLETRAANRTVKYVSETLSKTSATNKFVEASGSSFGIKKSSSGHSGKKAVLWKVVYVDGAEVSREKVNTSNYIMSPNIYKVGTSSANAAASALVKNAISSQNRDTIQAAINQANAMIAATQTPAPQTPPASGGETAQ